MREIPLSLKERIDRHEREVLPAYAKLWAYYRNPMREVSRVQTTQGRWYRLAQEAGLPARLFGRSGDESRAPRREIVVENDIAWRLHTMVDFLFGKGFTLRADGATPARSAAIERVLAGIFEQSGGNGLWQDGALLAHVFGHVDFLVVDSSEHGVRIEMIDPRRAVALVNSEDYRKIDAYAVHLVSGVTSASGAAWSRLTRMVTPDGVSVFEDGVSVDHTPTQWTQGRLPIAHVQNIAQPLSYDGLGEVESLIPLQDELNTRLSDRASRVTLQSFKMYLAKGIGGPGIPPVAPGQLWLTDNTDAAIDEFGGDASSPSEDRHIDEIRDALDKVSGVPPLASGVVQAKIGNLSSANALKVTLMSLLSKTLRKQAAYGRAIAELSGYALDLLHHKGIFRTQPQERRVHVSWPDPLPPDVRERVFAAEAKARLGAPRERILAELGNI